VIETVRGDGTSILRQTLKLFPGQGVLLFPDNGRVYGQEGFHSPGLHDLEIGVVHGTIPVVHGNQYVPFPGNATLPNVLEGDEAETGPGQPIQVSGQSLFGEAVTVVTIQKGVVGYDIDPGLFRTGQDRGKQEEEQQAKGSEQP
jgi:hypothetical protein